MPVFQFSLRSEDHPNLFRVATDGEILLDQPLDLNTFLRDSMLVTACTACLQQRFSSTAVRMELLKYC